MLDPRTQINPRGERILNVALTKRAHKSVWLCPCSTILALIESPHPQLSIGAKIVENGHHHLEIIQQTNLGDVKMGNIGPQAFHQRAWALRAPI